MPARGASPPVAVIGAGGHAKVVISTLEAAGRVVAAVFDDDPRHEDNEIAGVKVTVPVPAAAALRKRGLEVILAVGENRARAAVAERLEGAWWTVALHPSAMLDRRAVIQGGSLVCAGVVIQPTAQIGAHAIVNTGAIIEHDCELGAFCHVAPGAVLTGAARLGTGVLIGAASTILPGRVVGSWSIVGAGSVVTRDVAAAQTVVGVPAHPLRP